MLMNRLNAVFLIFEPYSLKWMSPKIENYGNHKHYLAPCWESFAYWGQDSFKHSNLIKKKKKDYQQFEVHF